MKKNKLFKYLFGSLAGVVLAGAVIGGVVSCSNGNTTTQPVSKPTTSTANNTISGYVLTDTTNTSTIAYKNAQNQNASEISMVATSSDVANYSTLANEPGNLAIYTNGSTTPTAIINSANATNNSTTTTLNLTLQKDSSLYNEWEKGNITNLNVLAQQLGSLISFSPTKLTDYSLTINYPNSDYANTLSKTTTNQPLNFYFTPNNAQWGASTNVPLQAELSLVQNSNNDKDYVAFSLPNSSKGNYHFLANDLINNPNYIFTSTFQIYYQANGKYYSDPITLNVSLLPYVSHTTNWMVNAKTYPLLPASTNTYTINPNYGYGYPTVQITNPVWNFTSLQNSNVEAAYVSGLTGGIWLTAPKGETLATAPSITADYKFVFQVTPNTKTNPPTYQISGNKTAEIIMLTPSGLIINNLEFASPLVENSNNPNTATASLN